MFVPRSELAKYRSVQGIAKQAILHLEGFVRSGMSELDVAEEADCFMKKKGVASYWYYGVMPMVWAGKRTRISVSGKNYVPTSEKIQENDLVKVDLAPEVGGRWSDLSRMLVVENGRVAKRLDAFTDELLQGFSYGVGVEELLHKKLLEAAYPEMSFQELFRVMNNEISAAGYVNLDFKGNLGHSIERRMDARRYIEEGNTMKLSEVGLFTFEPHISRPNYAYGFIKEDIYYFTGKGKLLRL